MRRSLRILMLSLALVPATAALPAASAHARAACASANLHPAFVAKRQARLVTLCLLNRERRAHGLRPLRLNRRLTDASIRHSRDMVRKAFFAHGNFVGRILSARYVTRRSAWTLGENIAWGTGHLATPSQIVRGWMNSSGHRHNILSRKYRDIGIGIALGAPGAARSAAAGATYTTDFGRRG
jgi:uncharacterized protein YkwD